VASSPGAEINKAITRKRFALRQAAGLAILAAAGMVLTARTPVFGGLVAGLAIAVATIEVVVIASAREQISRAADQLIDDGVPVGVDGGVAAAVEARLRQLGSERARRRTARALLDAIVDAARPRSSNPLVLASHTVVLGKGTAKALLVERDLAIKVAAALAQPDANPRAVIAVRNLLYPGPDAVVASNEQQQLAHRELGRAAHLLGIAAEMNPPQHR
jgi:hypothetical protein